jgi:hypothetical protein
MRAVQTIAIVSMLAGTMPVVSPAQTSSPVRVVIETQDVSPKSGARIDLKITVTNRSDQPISVYRVPGPDGQAEAVNKIEVRDPSGQLLARIDGRPVTVNGKLRMLPKRWLTRAGVILKPGEELKDFAVLTNLFDMTRPGAYEVTVRHELRVDDPGPDIKFLYTRSNTIKITVR